MIKVICINNEHERRKWSYPALLKCLLLNEVYDAEIVVQFHKCYRIFKNNLPIGFFNMDRFITMAEFREQRINSILN